MCQPFNYTKEMEMDLPNFKVVRRDDGTLGTVVAPDEKVAKEKLEQTRRDLRDMISGNAQFHVDPCAAPAEHPPPPGDWQVIILEGWVEEFEVDEGTFKVEPCGR